MRERLIEHIFFFGLLGLVGYIIWLIVAPFLGTLALAAILATVCYPLYIRITHTIPRKNRSVASFVTVVVIACTIFIPLIFLTYILFTQAAASYEALNAGTGGIGSSIGRLEGVLNDLVPGSTIDLTGYAKQAAGWLAGHTGAIFAGTASTVLMLFIMMIALFYMFKDGPAFIARAIRLSPLPDTQDEHIVSKLSLSVRSVVLGTLAVAAIQGILTAVGFAIFGISQPALWGTVAAIGALIPGVGTSIVFVVAIGVLLLGGSYLPAILLTVWGVFAVGLIDNLLGPYLMSRGAKLHPFAVLLAVLGGVALFGPVGFLVGPVALSFFTVLLELYSLHIRSAKKPADTHA